MYEIIPNKTIIHYSKGKSFTNLFDIAKEQQDKKDNQYHEIESEVINGKRYRKTTYYESISNEPTIQNLRKELGLAK